MRFIELTLLGEEDARNPTAVAVAHIVSIINQPQERCLLRLTNGEEIKVHESYEHVADLLMDSGATYK